ncbi:DUF7283 family protein [Halostella salina]|uniref:DUF7283 family protein n=1 Tax=Halostella salina TaxID=1547897 RepID=UPI000EF7DD75|nr:hypothetical protein [Halostella salina]
MFDAPVDAWYLTVGVALAGMAFAGVAADLPTRAPPDATAAAETVDAVAASEFAATAEQPVSADAVRLGPHRIALRNAGGTGRATFTYGPVTPVADGTLLWEVAQGADPEHVFESPADFAAAATDARDRDPDWHSADDRIVVRTVSWGEKRVTLVDA